MTVSQLTPNAPGHKGLHSNQWAVRYGRYMHNVTASHYNETNVLYVHIGCPVLLTDSVREGESVWEAIQRVVFAWQVETLESDHAEALAINAPSATITVDSQEWTYERTGEGNVILSLVWEDVTGLVSFISRDHWTVAIIDSDSLELIFSYDSTGDHIGTRPVLSSVLHVVIQNMDYHADMLADEREDDSPWLDDQDYGDDYEEYHAENYMGGDSDLMNEW